MNNNLAIVTGAASGIGLEISKLLKKNGYSLLLIDIDESSLKMVVEDLSAEYLLLDLTKLENLTAIENYINKKNYNLRCVINNAGIGARGIFDELSFDEQLKIIQLNCIATSYLSHLSIKKFRENRSGTLINISSSAAFQPLPYMSIYSATKAFVNSLSEAVSGELLMEQAKHNIEIINVCPAGTDTNFQKNSRVKKNTNEKLLSPEYVARRIISYIGKGSRNISIGMRSKIMNVMFRLLPFKIRITIWGLLMKKIR